VFLVLPLLQSFNLILVLKLLTLAISKAFITTVFYSLDGYTAVVSVEDAIITLKTNGKPLDIKAVFPARPFIPHLYSWKSAKWLTEIEFMKEYVVDGCWEERISGNRERMGRREVQRGKIFSQRVEKKSYFIK